MLPPAFESETNINGPWIDIRATYHAKRDLQKDKPSFRILQMGRLPLVQVLLLRHLTQKRDPSEKTTVNVARHLRGKPE